MPGGTLWRPAAALALSLAAGGCALAPWSRGEPPPGAPVEPVQLVSGGLLAGASGEAELGLTLENRSADYLWVQAHFRTPDGGGDCVAVKELAPGARTTYLCPQGRLAAGADYAVEITAYDDLEQSRLRTALATRFRFDAEDITAAGAVPPPP